MTDSLTILSHSRNPLTKAWKKDGSIIAASKAKYFTYENKKVSSINDLSDLLISLEQRKYSALIRGRFVGNDRVNGLVDSDCPKGKVARNLDTFEDQPLHSIMIEVDDFIPLISDPLNEPENAVAEYIEDVLPVYFHEKSYFFQLSSSAGKKCNEDILKAHIWFWLKEPMTSAKLKVWASSIDLKSDHSVYNPVQMHYTAAPIFEGGVIDPVLIRSGFVEGSMGSEVEFDDQAILASENLTQNPRSKALIDKLGEDPVVQRIKELDLLKSVHRSGMVYFQCPFADGHSQDSTETSTTYLPPHTNGYKYGAIKCFHNSCSNRTTAEFYDKMEVLNNVALDGQDLMGIAQWVAAVYYTMDGANTLLRHNAIWYRYNGFCYVIIDDEAIRAVIWQVLHGVSRKTKDSISPFRPKPSDVSGVLDALKSVIRREEIQANSWTNSDSPRDCISMKNGIFDVDSNSLIDHSPHFFTLNSLPFAYVEEGQPIEFIKFLEDIFDNDNESVETIQEIFGYLLTPNTSLQKMFMLLGPPRSGKGTITRILNDLLGGANICSSSFGSLSNDFGLEPMRNKLAAVFPDVRLGKRTDGAAITEKLLNISGEDDVIINEKYKAMSSDRISARILIVSNEIPLLIDASNALVSRFIFLETRKSYLGKENIGLSRDLKEELPQIFRWSLAGRKRLIERGAFVQPTVSEYISDDMFRLNNPVGAFISDRCQVGEGLFISKADLFSAYQNWCEEMGYKYTNHMGTFTRDLKSFDRRVTPDKKMENGVRYPTFLGITLDKDVYKNLSSVFICGGTNSPPEIQDGDYEDDED